MDDEALNKVQETLAHQEQQINDLSDMVVAQGAEIKALRAHINKIEGKVEELEEDVNVGGGEGLSSIEKLRAEKPPHY